MPVLQRGSSIKVRDIDFISSWFFLQASPRLVEAAIRQQKKYRIWQNFCLGQIQYLDISWPESSKTIRFQGEEMCNGEFDKHGSNAQQNKLYAPLLQFDANFAGDFINFINQGCCFFLSNQRCRLDQNWRGLTSENKIGTKPQVGQKKIQRPNLTKIKSTGLTWNWNEIKSKGWTPLAWTPLASLFGREYPWSDLWGV